MPKIFLMKQKKKYEEKNYEESKFLFQRNIVFNPKDAKSYLYLAKIFENEENEGEQIKNINTTLLLEPNNEEAMFILIKYELKKSNYNLVRLIINSGKERRIQIFAENEKCKSCHFVFAKEMQTVAIECPNCCRD